MTRILYVASEAYPLVKTGGLGDVAGALPRALRSRGFDVRVMLPAYGAVLRQLDRLSHGPCFTNVLGTYDVRLLSATIPGSDLPLWLVDCPALYARNGNPYCDDAGQAWRDNHLRFALLSRIAALAATGLSAWRPDIVHANDWHTGLTPYYLRSSRLPTVFTVHNMAYQGLFSASVLRDLDPASRDFIAPGLEFHGQASFLKAGLVYASRITTVSPTYAREILTPHDGCGLEGVLKARGDVIEGILNGIDETVWAPEADVLIPQPFDSATIALKTKNKKALRARAGLPTVDTAPVIGVVSRLVAQKGIDILIDILPQLFASGAQLQVLGAGDRDLEVALRAAAQQFPNQMAVHIGFDEAMAHGIMAGADILFVPSRYEPCGLTQLHAQRYGTIPVVHRVGGLADTVIDEEDGFCFDRPAPEAAVEALERAVTRYRRRARWRAMQRRAMRKRSGWDTCARRYEELYRSLLTSARSNPSVTETDETYGTALAASW